MKKIAKVVGKIFLGLLVLLLLLGIFTVATPWPVSMFVRQLFKNPPQKPPNDFDVLQSQVLVVQDIAYASEWKSNTFDFYYPANATKAVPVIIWVHGGAFVGGDKSDISIYSTMLAANGYAVVSMNYILAPEGRYPVAMRQIAEVYKHLPFIDKAIDLNQVIFAGDSAGANFAAQFVHAQSDAEFARAINVPQIVPPQDIAALLLYCGPYNLDSVMGIVDRGGVMGFIAKRIGGALIGGSKWEESPSVAYFSVTEYAGAHFPPTFITDASTMSFEEQGKELVQILEVAGVEVDSLFFAQEEYEISHEYQFVLNTKPAEICRENTLAFLEKHTK